LTSQCLHHPFFGEENDNLQAIIIAHELIMKHLRDSLRLTDKRLQSVKAIIDAAPFLFHGIGESDVEQPSRSIQDKANNQRFQLIIH
jgi:hypothetical protein